MTAISDAFIAAGFFGGSRLGATVSRIWQEADGDRARASKALWNALNADTEIREEAMQAFFDAMRGGGHIGAAQKGHATDAPAHTEQPGTGQTGNAQAGHRAASRSRLANAGKPASETGAVEGLPKGHANSSPAREPSRGAVTAAAMVARKAAQTVLDTFHITERNGAKTAVGDIRLDRCGTLLRTLGKRAWVSEREYNLIYLLKREADKFPSLPTDGRVRDVFTAEQVAATIKAAADLTHGRIGAESEADAVDAA